MPFSGSIYQPTPELIASLTKAVSDVAKSPRAGRFPVLSAHLGVAGCDYSGELLVVGRALNGSTHDEKWTCDKASDHAAAQRIVRNSIDWGDECPLKWVVDHQGNRDGYNTNRSPFWMASKELLEALEGERFENWSSRLAWSNLYKIAPFEGGNPSDALCEAQLQACIEIMNQEISALKPKRLLFMTGRPWTEWFEKGLGLQVRPRSDEYVEGVGEINTGGQNARFVISSRPEGKSRADWVHAVAEAFQSQKD